MKDISITNNMNIGVTENGKVLIWPFQKNNGSYIFRPVEIPFKPEIFISSVSCGHNFVM